MKGIQWLPLVALLAGCSSGANLGVHADDTNGGAKGYTFAYKPKVGDSATYAMKVGGTAAGQPISVEATVKMKITDAGSGNIKIETTTELPTGSQTTVETLDPSGKVIGASLDGKPVPDASSAGSTRDMMPGHPVKVGDSWSGTRTVGGQTMTAGYKLEKVETVGGVQLATIDITKLDAPQGKLAGPSSVVLEPATGMMHSMKVSLSLTAGTQTVTENISMEKK
jgi:hypothetical protein